MQVAGATHGHPHAWGLLLQHATTSPGSRYRLPSLTALAIEAILTIVEAILTIEATYTILTIEASWRIRRRVVETKQILTLYVDNRISAIEKFCNLQSFILTILRQYFPCVVGGVDFHRNGNTLLLYFLLLNLLLLHHLLLLLELLLLLGRSIVSFELHMLLLLWWWLLVLLLTVVYQSCFQYWCWSLGG